MPFLLNKLLLRKRVGFVIKLNRITVLGIGICLLCLCCVKIPCRCQKLAANINRVARQGSQIAGLKDVIIKDQSRELTLRRTCKDRLVSIIKDRINAFNQ